MTHGDDVMHDTIVDLALSSSMKEYKYFDSDRCAKLTSVAFGFSIFFGQSAYFFFKIPTDESNSGIGVYFQAWTVAVVCLGIALFAALVNGCCWLITYQVVMLSRFGV